MFLFLGRAKNHQWKIALQLTLADVPVQVDEHLFIVQENWRDKKRRVLQPMILGATRREWLVTRYCFYPFGEQMDHTVNESITHIMSYGVTGIIKCKLRMILIHHLSVYDNTLSTLNLANIEVTHLSRTIIPHMQILQLPQTSSLHIQNAFRKSVQTNCSEDWKQ